MEGNRFRELIYSGKYVLGLSTNTQNPAIIELAAYAGFQFPFSRVHERFGGIIRAADAAEIPIIVNVPTGDCDPGLIGKALDLGAAGIQLAIVSSKAEAERLVRMCKLPGTGKWSREAVLAGIGAFPWTNSTGGLTT